MAKKFLGLKVRKKQLLKIAGVAGLLVVAAGAGVALWWWQNRESLQAPQAFSTATEKALPKAADEAQKLALSGKPDEAAQKIQNALNQQGVGDADKQKLLIQEGVVYGNDGQHQKALDTYLQAEQAKSDFTTSHLVGEEYEALGNKTKAIEYYKKALSQLDSHSISYNMDKNYYEGKVKELGGTL